MESQKGLENFNPQKAKANLCLHLRDSYHSTWRKVAKEILGHRILVKEKVVVKEKEKEAAEEKEKAKAVEKEKAAEEAEMEAKATPKDLKPQQRKQKCSRSNVTVALAGRMQERTVPLRITCAEDVKRRAI